MSADHWAVCPKCEEAKLKDLAVLQRTVVDEYGKIPMLEHDELRQQVENAVSAKPKATFREDYEFYGVEDGTLNISYSGECSVCGLSKRYEHVEQVWPELES